LHMGGSPVVCCLPMDESTRRNMGRNQKNEPRCSRTGARTLPLLKLMRYDELVSAMSTLDAVGVSFVPQVNGREFSQATCPSLNNMFPP